MLPLVWLLIGGWVERMDVGIVGYAFPVVFFALLSPLFFGVIGFRCPRCGHYFFAPGAQSKHATALAIIFINRCQNCGIRVGQPQ